MKSSSQSGSIFYFILIGIVLIGGLTVALRDSGGLDSSIDKESATVQASQIIKYGGDVQKGVQTLLSNGISENDIRFAYPSAAAGYGTITTNPQNQVFSSQGGQIPYRKPPAGSNDGSAWGFHSEVAMHQAGSAKADLYALLSNLNVNVCNSINKQLGISSIPVVTNCFSPTPFDGTFASSPSAPNFSVAPSGPLFQACVQFTCDSSYRYVSTLLAR